jgi:hypothetical protein
MGVFSGSGVDLGLGVGLLGGFAGFHISNTPFHFRADFAAWLLILVRNLFRAGDFKRLPRVHLGTGVQDKNWGT